MKPRTVCACHWVTRMISAIEAPLERCSMRMTCAFLVPVRTPVAFARALLLRGVLDRPIGRANPFSSALQMRSSAVLRSVKRLTGGDTGKAIPEVN